MPHAARPSIHLPKSQGPMKHKGARDIPDFSRKPKAASGNAPGGKAATGRGKSSPVKPQATKAKPQATSSKSGHRGK
jgi:hypothetical protein